MTTIQEPNPQHPLETITKDPAARRALARESHLLFFTIYLSHYIKYPMARFQKEIFRITEDETNPLACIVAFRGSAKSTIVTLSYAIWAILGVQGKKFIIIVCQTQPQARQHMMNLRRELEQNELLRSDLGPFQEETGSGEWAMSSIVFKNTDARIMVASMEQSIRGVRHREHRADVIIMDDTEDMNSTRTMESRNKTFEWFSREIAPLGDLGTRIIMVGNLVHEDSLMMRLQKRIEAKEMPGSFHTYPLLSKGGTCLWPEKFDTTEKIENLKKSVVSDLAWQQEYLLNPASDCSKVIWPEWIQYYDELPKQSPIRLIFVGVDLAISRRDEADCTSMVAIGVYGYGKELRGHVLPIIVNERIDYDTTVAWARQLNACFRSQYQTPPTFIVESNGFQEVYADAIADTGCTTESVKNTTLDKRSRLATISHLVKNGTILFPKEGAEIVIKQLVGFGKERHDDAADAFAMAAAAVLGLTNELPFRIFVG